MDSNMVEEWLRSLDLVQYTEAFLDNGYDDLEICKQIGQPDLDAIGVKISIHRHEILKAVANLRDQGATAVYFTLEEFQNGDDSGFQENSSCDAHAPSPARLSGCFDTYGSGKNLVKFPKLQLNLMIQNRLLEEDINLTDYPYCTPNGQTCSATMQPLALRYAEDFNTHWKDVMERMDDIKRKKLMCSADSPKNTSSPSWDVHNQCTAQSSPRGVAPPLPSSPPHLSYSWIYNDGYDSLEDEVLIVHAPSSSPRDYTMRTVCTPRSGHSSGGDSPCPDTTEHDGSRRGSGIGRFFRGTIRRSARKYSYKQHQGDPLASEITMPEEERIELMLMVKEGRISLEDAMSKLKNYEDAHRPQNEHKENKKDKSGKLSSRRKRRNGDKRTRSQSDGGNVRSLSCSPCRGFSDLNDLSRESPASRRLNNMSPAQQGGLQCVRQRSFESGALPAHLRDPLSRSNAGVIRSMPNSPCHSSRTSSVSSVGNISPMSVRSDIKSSPPLPERQYSQKNIPSHNIQMQETPSHKQVSRTRSSSPSVHQLSHSSSPISDRFAAASGFLASQQAAIAQSSSPQVTRRAVQVTFTTEDPPALPPRNKPQSPHTRSHAKITHAQVHSTGTDSLETRSVVESDRSSVQSPLEDDTRSISTMSVGSDMSPVSERKQKVLHGVRNRSWRSNSSCGEEVNSSDYEDQDEFDQDLERSAIHRESFNDKLKNEVRKHFSQIPSLSMTKEIMDVANKHASGSSSCDSAPSSSSCNKRSHSSTSTEEDSNQSSGIVGRARAVADYVPDDHEKDRLTLKRGDVISVIEKNPSGLWTGALNGHTGKFKLVDVEIISDGSPRLSRKNLKHSSKKRFSKRSKPRTLEELLKRLGLESLTQVFVQNGYTNLEAFSELENNDLDDLRITNPEQRAKLLTAADLVNDLDYDTPDSPEITPRNQLLDVTRSHVTSCDSPRRDSGCYASSENLKERSPPSTVGKSSSKCSSASEEVAAINGCGNIPPSDVDIEVQDTCTQTGNTLEKLDENKENQLTPPLKPKIKPKPSRAVSMTTSATVTSPTVDNFTSVVSPSRSAKECPPVPRKPKPQAPARSVSLKSQVNIVTSQASSSSSSTPSGSPCHVPKMHHSALSSPIHASNNSQSLHVTKGHPVVLQSFANLATPPMSPQGRQRSKPPVSPKGAAGHIASQRQASRPSGTSIENLVITKLQQEMIQLTEEPYTDMAGFCGIPPALVLRYAEELGRQDIRSMANAMENVRCLQLKSLGLIAVPNDQLGESCINPIYDNVYSSMEDFLIVNGLPMYINAFHTAGYVTLELIKDMQETQLKKCCVKDGRHVRRLIAAIDALRYFMASKELPCPHHWKGKIDVMDKV